MYGRARLCLRCTRAHGSYCIRKIQGIEREHILPRHGIPETTGNAYLCILCGYWHWTSNTGEVPEDLMQTIWKIARYFERISFHINIARGWAFIAYVREGK